MPKNNTIKYKTPSSHSKIHIFHENNEFTLYNTYKIIFIPDRELNKTP